MTLVHGGRALDILRHWDVPGYAKMLYYAVMTLIAPKGKDECKYE